VPQLSNSDCVRLVTPAVPASYKCMCRTLLSKTGTNLTASVGNGRFACPELEF
jgi:hypothetical protein